MTAQNGSVINVNFGYTQVIGLCLPNGEFAVTTSDLRQLLWTMRLSS